MSAGRSTATDGLTLAAVDPTTFVLAVCMPGFALFLAGLILMIASRQDGKSRLWGKRLYYGGLGLLYVTPSAGVILAVIGGKLMWPALLFPVLTMPLGIGILYGLRIWWANPTDSK